MGRHQEHLSRETTLPWIALYMSWISKVHLRSQLYSFYARPYSQLTDHKQRAGKPHITTKFRFNELGRETDFMLVNLPGSTIERITPAR